MHMANRYATPIHRHLVAERMLGDKVKSAEVILPGRCGLW